MLYSKSTGGFYSLEINGENIPVDALAISDEDYASLMSGQSSGKAIVANETGYPGLVDLVSSYDREALRRAAYTIESDPLFFQYQRGEATREDWLSKVAEIQARHP